MKNTVIFDLDGTLAKIDKRIKLARKPNGKMDFDILHDRDNIYLDEPNEPVVRIAELFADDGLQIVIFTGRPDTTESVTRQWLAKHGIPYHKLVMRDNVRYFKPDELLKKQNANVKLLTYDGGHRMSNIIINAISNTINFSKNKEFINN